MGKLNNITVVNPKILDILRKERDPLFLEEIRELLHGRCPLSVVKLALEELVSEGQVKMSQAIPDDEEDESEELEPELQAEIAPTGWTYCYFVEEQ